MKFLDAVWARFNANNSPAADPGSLASASGGLAPGIAVPPPREPRAGIEGLAVRCATALPPGVFSDRQRLKWILLQPEVAAGSLKFASLAGLGDKRAAEALEARDSLRGCLVAELPAEKPEHIEMLLDAMQRDAKGAAQSPAGGSPSVYGVSPGSQASRSVVVPEVRTPAAASGFPAQAEYTAPLAQAYAPQPAHKPVEAAWAATALQPETGSVAAVEYELHVLPGTTVHDLEDELVREYVRGSTRRRSRSPLSDIGALDVMRTVKAIDGPVGRERLTVLGGLFFGRQPERLVVQSKVRFVEFPGVEVASAGERVAYRYSEEVTGTITQLIARMERLHKERLAPGVLADGFRVEELPAVPLFALREAMVNAVCHRDYSLVGANIQVRLFADRLEVQSPGGLPGPVTVDNILTESYARNPRVADILRDLGYVERHGLGIDNMFTSMEEAHLPAPEFSNSATSFTVTLRFRLPDESDPESWLAEIGAASVDHTHQRALVFARRTGRIVSSDYQSLSGADATEAEHQLRSLVRDGWLVQNATGSNAYYTLGPSADSTHGAVGEASPLPQSALDSLSGSQRRILDIVIRQGKVKASEVLEISALKDRRTIQRALSALTQAGLVIRRASSRTDPNASYEVNRAFGEEDRSPASES